MIEIIAMYVYIYDNIFLAYLMRKERFPTWKTKLVWESSRRCNTF